MRIPVLLSLVLVPSLFADALAPLPEDRWDRAAAAHLLRRAGFGGTPEQVAALAAIGPDAAVGFLVDYEKQPQGEALAMLPANLDGPEVDRQIRARIAFYRQQIRRYQQQQLRLRGADPAGADRPGPTRQREMQAENRAVNEVTNRLDRQRLSQLRSWWLARMVAGKRPLEEKMVLFWHGHFTSGYETVRSAEMMYRQNRTFRTHATGDFGALTRAVVRDGAMLRYLDGGRNIKQRPNENFARELLELFTLGRGHYSEKDVKEAARALTGWRMDGGGVSYNRYLHDYGTKTFLGKTGEFGADEIVAVILEQEQASRWLAGKLARFFVAHRPDPALVAGLAASLREHRFRLKPVLRALFRSSAFYAPGVVGRQIKSPTQVVVETIRLVGLPIECVGMAEPMMAQMGQVLFQPPNVKGWDGGASWINASTLLVRYNLYRRFTGYLQWVGQNKPALARWRQALPRGLRARANPRAFGQDVQLFLPVLRRFANVRDGGEALDGMLSMLLARPLSKERRDHLLKLLAPGGRFDGGSHFSRVRMLAVLQLILGMPEFQLG